MRVALVITRGDSIGGAQIHVRDIAAKLSEDGHDVCVFFGGVGDFQKLLESFQIPSKLIPSLVHPISPFNDVRAIIDLTYSLKQYKPDLIAAHSTKAGIVARIAGFLLRTPVLFTVHGWAFTEGVAPIRRRIYRLIEWIAAPLTNQIICVSEYDRQLAIRERVVNPQKLITIHNGVANTNRIASPNQNPPRIAMVARLAPPKEHDTLFRVLKVLPHVNLELVGDGPRRAELESLASSLGIADRVHFLGNVTQVEQVLERVQIFVLTSNYEAFPLSILEAMRAGLPVVASDVGGVSEAVIDGETGYLVQKGNTKMLYERLLTLINDSTLRASMGNAGRRRYLKHFTSDSMLYKTTSVYEEVVINS